MARNGGEVLSREESVAKDFYEIYQTHRLDPLANGTKRTIVHSTCAVFFPIGPMRIESGRFTYYQNWINYHDTAA